MHRGLRNGPSESCAAREFVRELGAIHKELLGDAAADDTAGGGVIRNGYWYDRMRSYSKGLRDQHNSNGLADGFVSCARHCDLYTV